MRDQDSAQTWWLIPKFPCSNMVRFKLWRMKIEQYIQMINYALWEVIENGVTLPNIAVVEGVEKVMPITSAEDKAQRRLEMKVPMNITTKKTQRNLLKQQYENFTAPSSEMLDQTFDRLQKLVSQLELLDEKLSQEDVNQKLLRSLSPEWNTHAVMWRNKAKLETMSMNDLYNNHKMYEPEVKAMSSSILSTQNMDFVSSSNNNTSSSNEEVNAAHGVTTASTQVNVANSTNIDNLSDVVICAFFASQSNSSQLVHEDLQQIYPMDNGREAPRNQDNKNKESSKRSVPVEISTSTSLVSCDGLGGYNWSDQAEEGPNYALMAYSSSSSDSEVSNDSEFHSLHRNSWPPIPDFVFTGLDKLVNKTVVENRNSDEEVSKFVRKSDDSLIIEVWVSDSEEENVSQTKTEKKIVKPSIAKIEFVNSMQQEKTARKINVVPRAVLMKSGLVSINTARQVNTTHSKTTVNAARPMSLSFLKNSTFPTVKTDQSKEHTFKIVILIKIFILIGLQLVSLETKDKVLDHVSKHNSASITLKKFDYIDAQGRSKHMTGNMSYLTDYEEIDRGYVTFGGNPKGGKITRKGLIDESQVLLRVPRKNNMYSVDLKNIVPKGGLTCLFAKATSDESKLWHRRLGHLNFKTMNKLVKGNLVRGLPSKLFENDQTCVACQKGKKHRASSTKQETSGILKSFITGIENLVDHKVKVIRCDNETERNESVL
ncbi:putative ribonuclease H-like domain-containing protein [Tanacetum coccineum]